MLPSRRMVIAFLVVVVLPLTDGALAHWVIHGPIDAASLATSVDDATGGAPMLKAHDACRRSTPSRWRCEITFNGGSDAEAYDVDVRPGTSCWQARAADDLFTGAPRHADGCVRLWSW